MSKSSARLAQVAVEKDRKKEQAMMKRVMPTLRNYVRDMKMTKALKQKFKQVARQTTMDFYRAHMRDLPLTMDQQEKLKRDIEKINSYIFEGYTLSTRKILLIVYGISLVLAFFYFSYKYDEACSLPENSFISAATSLYRGGQRLAGQLPSCQRNQEYYSKMMNFVEGLGASSFAAAALKWIARNGEQYILGSSSKMGQIRERNRFLEGSRMGPIIEEID